MKPSLADNYDAARLQQHFAKGGEVWMQPKVDGVRGMNITGTWTGRSLKAYKNKALTAYYSQPQFAWLDGEMVLPGGWTQPRLCSLTTGLTGRVNDPTIPEVYAFDYLDPLVCGLSYADRYAALEHKVLELEDFTGKRMVHLMPAVKAVRSMEQVLELDTEWLDMGLEGSIIRDAALPLKEGRSGTKLFLWRIKRFIDYEFTIDSMYEAQENQNEAKINELGHTERSSHKENKVGKGMVGGFIGRFLADLVHNGETLFKAGDPIRVGSGQSTHEERELWWREPHLVVGQIGKAKLFPQGILAKPRMPIFLGLRAEEDMS